MSFNKYPYTDFHEMNQDWIITKFQKFYKDFTALYNTVNTKLKEFELKLNLKADKTYVDTALEKKADKTYVDTELEKKADKTYVDTELEKKADTEYVNDNFANALKGNANGSVISVDDVSPVQHNVKCKAEGKNLADVSKMELGLYTDEKFTVGNKKEPFHSFKAYLEKGTYTINSKDKGIVLLRFIADNKFITKYQTVPFTFTTTTDDYVGFGFRRIDEKPLDNTEEIQINRGSEATPYIPYVDVSNTNVNVCGKNLANLVQGVINNAGGELGLTDNPNYRSVFYENFPKGTYILSCEFPITIIRTVVSGVYSSSPYADVYTFEHNGGNFGLSFRKTNNTPFGDSKAQLEIGSVATPYEAYQGADYTPNADGTVNGIKSIAPNMTITSDTDGVNIDCEYNRDINKALAALEGGAQ